MSPISESNSATRVVLPASQISLNGDMNTIHESLSTLLLSVRRHLHRNPEIGLKEFETSRFIREVLEMHGMSVQGPLAETGLYVDIAGEHPGPTIAYRCDIDALPIEDGKHVEYRSQNPGLAHLCGHDAHTAIAIEIAQCYCTDTAT